MFRQTLLQSLNKKRRNLPGKRISKARRLAFLYASGYFLIVGVSVILVIYEIGVAGGAFR